MLTNDQMVLLLIHVIAERWKFHKCGVSNARQNSYADDGCSLARALNLKQHSKDASA
jgi:hypothetical protein